MTELRCERGAEIARMIELTETTAEAIAALDEHWDGTATPTAWPATRSRSRPHLCLAQTVEVFFAAAGPRAAFDVAADRRGTWFDPRWSTRCAHAPRPRVLELARRPRAARVIGASSPRTASSTPTASGSTAWPRRSR